jgi:drug/metabolite transporter (DMT)-like permease
MFWLFMILTLLFDLGGIVAGRYAAERKQPVFFYVCIASFVLVGLFVALMMQYRGVALVTIIWAGLAPVLALLAGYYLFGESLSFRQLAGTALIFVGVAMVEWPREKQREGAEGAPPSELARATRDP